MNQRIFVGVKRHAISQLLDATLVGQNVTVCGWVRTFRNNQFLSVNDGSSLENLQLVIDREGTDEALLKRLATGAAIRAEGTLVESQGSGQATEVDVKVFEVLGEADPEVYPIQMKRHTMEFLREKAHLRFRTSTFNAVFRLRHGLQYAIHEYFDQAGFYMLHTPIITGSDAEGAGEMFQVTTLDLNQVPKNEEGEVDHGADFFGKPSNLTVSGQLEAELGAMALGKVYTFGPTFRAENSNTSRHLAEFWMIEPEVAFNDLTDNMDLAEDCLRFVLTKVLERFPSELEFLAKREADIEKQLPADQRNEMGLIERLRFVTENPYVRITYTEAIDLLRNSKPFKKKKFKYPVELR